MSHILIYTTFPNTREAEKAASVLLEKRLVACVNIMAAHTAIYRWEHKNERTQEITVFMKTRSDLFEPVREAVCAISSFQCPCVIALPIEAGHAPFLQWIDTQTGK